MTTEVTMPVRRNAKQWTKDDPTEPGLYWWCLDSFGTPKIVNVWDYKGELYVDDDGRLATYTQGYGYWQGPIKVPAPPEPGLVKSGQP